MKNKKIFIIIGIFIILTFGIFLLNGNKGIVCHNLDWKDNPNKVMEKLSKLNLVYDNTSLEGENKQVDINECISLNNTGVLLNEEYIKSSSPSINISDVNLDNYKIRTIHDANQEIIEVSEIFVVREYEYDEFINSLKDKLLDLGAKYDSNDESNNTIYKTKSNYITLIYNRISNEGLYEESEYEIIINYYNPKFSKEDISSGKIYNSIV